ncbi:Putative lipoprotein [Constantimarinum furrinae]|uniref:Lipoprotein n=2 Tax=Constantimarinum furrinae TaxID=2562285 RepID=A0A7G8PTU6_9FLAO|nr:Putative lipoprotein [Constantimarinum furrinae]
MMIAIIGMMGCQDKKEDYSPKKEPSKKGLTEAQWIDKGEYLVKAIGCDHCHTPKKMTENGPVSDLDRWLMGHPADAKLPPIDKSQITPGGWILFHSDLTAAVGPWGVSFGANLTPDDTGIGKWSFAQFKKAMTEGKYKGMEGTRPIMPPMPWQSFAELKEDDLKAIYKYLMSIDPIENVVPAYIPPDQIQ